MRLLSRKVAYLAAALAVSGLPVFSPGSVDASVPGEGEWLIQDIPSSAGNVILQGSEIVDIAVASDGTIYVIDKAGEWLYKSADAGQSFAAIKGNYASGAGGVLPTAISVASDNASVLAVTDGTHVIVTQDGGNAWTALNPALPAGIVITDIAVSPVSSASPQERRYFIATANTAANSTAGGSVLSSNGTAWTGFPLELDFTSIEVTPNYATDNCIAAVGTADSAGSTSLVIINSTTTGVMSTSTLNGSGATGDFGGTTGILSSCIALPGDFDPNTPGGNFAYVGFAGNGDDNNVYLIDCGTGSVTPFGPGEVPQIASLSYSGNNASGILFAGLRNSLEVYSIVDPSSGQSIWDLPLTLQSGVSATPNVIVRADSNYASTYRIYAGTSGEESGFNVSEGFGQSFSQEALIDTGSNTPGILDGLSFLSSTNTALVNTKDSNGYISVWESPLPLSDTSWSRVFTVPLADPQSSGKLRANDIGESSMYAFFETATPDSPVYMNMGSYFNPVTGPQSAGCKDVLIATAGDVPMPYIVYCDMSGNIYLPTDGWIGNDGGVGAVESIVALATDQLAISNSTVALSSDGGTSFLPINDNLPAGTGYILAADTDYASNNYLYTASTQTDNNYAVYRANTASANVTWEDMGVSIIPPAGGKVVALGCKYGAIYVLTNQVGAAGGVLRATNPAGELNLSQQNWKALSNGLTSPMTHLAMGPETSIYVMNSTSIFAFDDILAPPKNLAVTGLARSVTLGWESSSNDGGSPITGYNVYKQAALETPGNTPPATVIPVSGNTLNDTDVVVGQKYYYWVTAVNAIGESESSNVVEATPVNPPGPNPPPVKPAPPVLSVTGFSSRNVNLTWTEPSETGDFALAGYRLYREDAQNGTKMTAFSSTVNDFIDTMVIMGTEYRYWVTAVNAGNVGSLGSNEVTVVPCSLPGPPLNLRIKEIGGNFVTVTWDKPASDGGSPVTAYTIIRSESSGQASTLTASGFELSDTPLVPGKTYSYKVSAINAVGQSDPSNELLVNIPAPPTPETPTPEPTLEPEEEIENVGKQASGGAIEGNYTTPAVQTSLNSLVENVKQYLWAVILVFFGLVVVILYLVKKL